MNKKTSSHRSKKPLWKKYLFFSVVVALLLLALTSFWLHNTIFNTERFTEIATDSFIQESSRQSMSETITARILDDRPVLKAIASDRLSTTISSILATEQAEAAITRVSRETQLLVTSPRREPVVLELSSLKNTILGAQELVQVNQDDARIDAAAIPDQVLLIDTANLPNFFEYAIVMLWLGPAALLTAALMLIWWIRHQGSRYYIYRSKIALTVIIATSGLALIVGPLIEPVFISIGRDAASQTFLGNLYRGFIAPFQNQAILLASVSTLLLALLVLWQQVLSKYQVKVSIVPRKL